jgi:AGZA family xanthine/uracil permease-like MFS transporter
VRFRGGLPGGLVAIVLGTALAWGTGLAGTSAAPTATLGFYLPVPVIGDLLAAFTVDQLLTYVAVIIPMGVFNIIGSLQNIESAEAAGDRYATGPSLTANGLGTIAAALFGSCFPTTIYIGHPGWKALGARAGYSVLNAAFCTVLCLTGAMALVAWAVPIEAGMAIVLWIGIVITAQAFQATPKEHAPAVVLGLLPGIGAWGALMAKDGLRAAGATFSPDLITKFQQNGSFIHGAFALEQGFIFTAMVFAAVTVHLIERRHVPAAVWCFIAAALCASGFMHSYTFTPADAIGALGTPAWEWAIGYTAMAVTFLVAKWVTEPDAPWG